MNSLIETESSVFKLYGFYVFLKVILTKRSVSNDQKFLYHLRGQFRLTGHVRALVFLM